MCLRKLQLWTALKPYTWTPAACKVQLGPQQLRYITVLRDSSACLSLLASLPLETLLRFLMLEASENLLTFSDEQGDVQPESPLEAWPLLPCIP